MWGKITDMQVKVCLCEFMKYYHKWNSMTFPNSYVFTVLNIYQVQKVTKQNTFFNQTRLLRY